MAYANVNFATKKALKQAVKDGQPIGTNDARQDGRVFLEGPWYPKPHSWYAEATVQDGIIVRVK